MSPSQSAVREYARVDASTRVMNADPHELILMLMNGALDSMAAARGFMARGAVEEKGRSLARAIAIIDGLRASLDRSASAELVDNLDDLYDYMGRRLLHANLRDDAAAVDEVAGLLREIRFAWEAIPSELRQRVDQPAVVP
jgi:flagellar protein FliS